MDTKYFQTGGLTIAVHSEIPFTPDTFHANLKQFEIQTSDKINITITHYFNKTMVPHNVMGDRIYQKKPWAIYQSGDVVIYDWIQDTVPEPARQRKIIADKQHTKLDIYNDSALAEKFQQGQITEISLLPTDQIFLARALAYKDGCIIHSMGSILNNNGYLFVGHSGAGKSTMARIMQDEAIILCDDRNIIRQDQKEYTLYGTWRHSDFSKVSPLSAPLKGIFFLNQSPFNQIALIQNPTTRFRKLLSCLVKPLANDNWWNLSIDFLDKLSKSVDCWDLKFDKSGKCMDHIKAL